MSSIQRLRQFVIQHPELTVEQIHSRANAAGIPASMGTVKTVAYHTRQTLELLEIMGVERPKSEAETILDSIGDDSSLDVELEIQAA